MSLLGCGYTTHAKCLSKVSQNCYTTASNMDLLGHYGEPAHDGLFGTDLTERAAIEHRSVPLIVQQCIAAVEARGMDLEGIYRKSGGAAQMRTIQQSYETQAPLDLLGDDINDICAITSVLKHYFRQLPDPLLTFALYDTFLDVARLEPGQSKVQAFIHVLSQLPSANYDTLRLLLQHLNRYVGRTEKKGPFRLIVCRL